MPPSSAEVLRMRRDLDRVRRAIAANLAVIQARTEQGKRLIEEREAIRFALRDVEEGDAATNEVRRRPAAVGEPAPVGLPAEGDVLLAQERPAAPAPAHGDV